MEAALFTAVAIVIVFIRSFIKAVKGEEAGSLKDIGGKK